VTPAPRAGRMRMEKILVVAVAVLALAELTVRARASTMPDPPRWSAPEIDYKEAQVERLQARGGASVVFLGSSVIDAAANPTLVASPGAARPPYNAGFGGGSVRMINTWATKVAVPRLKPDVVVLGLASRDLNPNDPEQVRLEQDFVAARAVKELTGRASSLDRAERRLERSSALFKYRSQLRRPQFFANFVGVGHAPRRGSRPATTSDGG